MRLLLGALLLGTLFLAAALWQRHWTSTARATRAARISGIEPRVDPDPARESRANLGEGWSRVLIGRPSGGEAYRAQVPPEPAVPGRAQGAPEARSVASQSLSVPAGKPDAKPDVILVQPGQSLSTICRQHYGTARLEVVEAVANFNRLASPDQLRAGAELELPSLEKLLPRR